MTDTSKFNAPTPDHAAYMAMKPFPYMVIDNFLPEAEAQAAHDAFPKSSDELWANHGRNYKNADNADKFEMTKYQAMHPALKHVVDVVNGPEFTQWLNDLTGFTDLTSDMTLNGGGLNMVKPGGFLRIHADFNWSNELNAYRTVNVLYYLNKNWDEAWGGNLELWEQDMSACVKAITPEFNRLAVFTTFNSSFHGYRKVVGERTRNSFNFYFYRKEAAPGIEKSPHKTMWRHDANAY